MKQYIKNEEIFDSPIVIINEDGSKTITNDETKILAAGYEIYTYTPQQKPLEILIQESNNEINKRTDAKILNNFVWNESEFYLTAENQMNFANMYIAKDYLIYPQTIKTKTGFIELSSAQEVTEFYLSGIQFVKLCLEEGWAEKEEAAEEIRNSYE